MAPPPKIGDPVWPHRSNVPKAGPRMEDTMGQVGGKSNVRGLGRDV